MFKRSLCCIIVVAGAAGCRYGKCTNDNLIFKRYTPFQKEYKVELVKQLGQVKGDVEYRISERVMQNWRTYMMVNVTADNICAKAAIDITNADNSRLAGFKKSVGGYRGAVVNRLQFTVDTSGGDYNLVYSNSDDISD